MGVDGLTGLLVGQEDVLVLVDDVELGHGHGEIGVFSPGLVEEFVVDIELEHVALQEPGVPLGALAVDLDALEADIFLQQRRRQQRHGLGHKPVQPLARVVFAYGELFHKRIPFLFLRNGVE